MLKVIENEQMSFNYDAVPAPVAIKAREAAERIKLRLHRSAEDIIEIGKDLVSIKESIGHGKFIPWINSEFQMSEATAKRFMSVARYSKGKSLTLSDLEPTALYELAAPKTPIEVREEIEKMIEAGEVVTKATVAKLTAEIEAAKKGRDLADHDATVAEEKAEALKTGLDTLNKSIDERVSAEVAKASENIRSGYEDEIERLKAQIEDLRKPKNITTIDNETGNIIQFHREMSEDEAAEIDATGDEMIGADFNEVATDTERAVAFFGSVRAMASAKADPSAVYAYIVKRSSKTLIAEYMGMVDAVMSQLKSVKDMHNG
ncbi:DUF3102 domain-containing protein [Agrobacterium sp. MCAB5]|uniref:DUF3102 domain-containing protein n=1 Tax=Agrobacterium sp. MCAB5 TaxID=3233042 RepID=UPI003F8E9104